jgi:tetratricopeptide (TPR) repeat protein
MARQQGGAATGGDATTGGAIFHCTSEGACTITQSPRGGDATGGDATGGGATSGSVVGGATYDLDQYELYEKNLKNLGSLSKAQELYYKGLDYYFEKGRQCDDEAIKHFDQALALDPNNPEVLSIKAQVFVDQGRFEEAIVYFDKILASPAADDMDRQIASSAKNIALYNMSRLG